MGDWSHQKVPLSQCRRPTQTPKCLLDLSRSRSAVITVPNYIDHRLRDRKARHWRRRPRRRQVPAGSSMGCTGSASGPSSPCRYSSTHNPNSHQTLIAVQSHGPGNPGGYVHRAGHRLWLQRHCSLADCGRQQVHSTHVVSARRAVRQLPTCHAGLSIAEILIALPASWSDSESPGKLQWIGCGSMV